MALPHDSLFKDTFSDVKRAAVELRAMLPSELLPKLDLSTLQVRPGSFVDRSLRQVHSDLLYSVQLGSQQAYIYVLLEHQSSPDATMPFRLLEYLVRIWHEHMQRTKRSSERSLPLPVIIPLVLHHGESGWNTSRQFHDLFDPELLALTEVAALVPSFRFLLDDLNQVSDAALQARAHRDAELSSESSPELQGLAPVKPVRSGRLARTGAEETLRFLSTGSAARWSLRAGSAGVVTG